MTSASNSGNRLSINDFEMYYETHGNGFPLLLLHGFTGSGASLIQGFNQLSSDHKLIIPDLRGHGRSTNPSKQFTFQQIASDIFALLEHLKITKCAAVGFSGGGCALLHMASQQSQLFRSMAIVSATPYFPQVTRELMQKISVANKTAAEWAAMREIHFHGDEQIKLLWEQSKAFSESYTDMNFTSETLARITTKTLIMQGDRDPLYPLELSFEMYKAMKNSSLWIVPNGGHVPITADTMQEFIDNLRKFLP